MKILLPFLIFFHLTAFSQNNFTTPISSLLQTKISGVVVDSLTGKSIEFASVRVFSYKDSSVIGGALTDSLGNFRVEEIKAKKVFLKISFVGYETKLVSDFNMDSPLASSPLRISLRSSLQVLDEINVVGEMDVFKTGIDKKIYNVSEDLNNQGGSASDVLNNVPSVDVDQDGNISLRGDGNVIILVDGRPSTLTLNGGLRGLPANSIERIEIVTNPSAKYDPDGTSGIINVVLKKAKLKGINGIISGTAGTGNAFNGAATLNIRTGKFNLFANYANLYNEGFRNFNSELFRTTNIGTEILVQDRPGESIRKNQNLRLGMDYYISDRQTIGFSVNGAVGDDYRYSVLENNFFDISSNLVDAFSRNSTDLSDDINLDFNLNYQNQLKNDKGELSANFTTSFEDENEQGFYTNKYRIDNYLISSQNPLSQRLNKNEFNSVSTGQIDYVKTLKKAQARIETGAKAIIRNQDLITRSETFDPTQNMYLSDTLANFNYQYNEQVYSLYGIWGQQKGKFKYQVGIRGEYAQQNPNLIDQNVKIINDYFNLFPSGHVRYDLGKKQELSLSYGRRINRASSNSLNPFTNYSDPLNLRFGNPFLNPEYINSYELGYSIEKGKLNFTSSIFYRLTTDVIQRVKVFYDDGVTGTTYGNIDESKSYGVEAIINYRPFKWWRNTISLNGDRIEYFSSAGDGGFNNSGFNLAIKLATTVEFWKNTASFQVNVRANTPRITAQGKVLPRSAIDISGDKRLNSQWSFGFRVSDILNTQGFNYELAQGPVRQNGEYKWLTRRAYVTITYKFGKLEVSKKGGRTGDSAGGGGGGFDF